MNRAELEAQRRQLEDALAAVFRTATAANHHDPGALSISGLGGCTRRAAYQLARYAPTDDHSHQEQRASHLGQATHDWVLPRLAAQLGHELTLVEHDVILPVRGLKIPGRLDLFTPAIGGGLLVDLKTHGYDQGDDGDEPSRARLLQLYGYATALRLMGYLIRAVAVVPMSRIHGGTSGVWIGEFGSKQEAFVDARVRDLLRHAKAPAFAPRDAHRGPGLDLTCDSCPYMTRCWPGAEPPRLPRCAPMPTSSPMPLATPKPPHRRGTGRRRRSTTWPRSVGPARADTRPTATKWRSKPPRAGSAWIKPARRSS
uniref:PD-(D/E)XK nuclease family protein n=1 Tax=Kitasatospora sp. NBC_01519 TaxID=2903576 RepID=UPI002F9076A1